MNFLAEEEHKRKFKGFGGSDYHHTRLNKPAVKFSLKSRLRAVSDGIIECFPDGAESLLDIGTADGLLASGVKERVPGIRRVFGLDLQSDQLKYNPFMVVSGDCCLMPFAADSFDIITAAAVIEHLNMPEDFLKECYRVLKPGGGLFLTCPAPFFEWVATKMGYLKYADHVARYGLSDLRVLCDDVGFRTVMAKKFMVAPLAFPGHLQVESVLRSLGLSFLMLNQVVGAVKD